MFPNPQHTPARASQSFIYKPITLFIGGKLGSPKYSVAFGLPPVFRTAVPKTTVHKHNHALSPESKIRLSR
jgi:hypothetical protein